MRRSQRRSVIPKCRSGAARFRYDPTSARDEPSRHWVASAPIPFSRERVPAWPPMRLPLRAGFLSTLPTTTPPRRLAVPTRLPTASHGLGDAALLLGSMLACVRLSCAHCCCQLVFPRLLFAHRQHNFTTGHDRANWAPQLLLQARACLKLLLWASARMRCGFPGTCVPRRRRGPTSGKAPALAPAQPHLDHCICPSELRVPIGAASSMLCFLRQAHSVLFNSAHGSLLRCSALWRGAHRG